MSRNKPEFDLELLSDGAALKETPSTPERSTPVKESEFSKIVRKIPVSVKVRIQALKDCKHYRLSQNDFFVDAVLEKLEKEERIIKLKAS